MVARVNSQLLSWAQLALQSHGNTLQDVSFKPKEFFAVNPVRVKRGGVAVGPGVGDISNDSVRAIFASHLNRYYSFRCGSDLLQNDIIAEFDFNNHGLVDTQNPPLLLFHKIFMLEALYYIQDPLGQSSWNYGLI